MGLVLNFELGVALAPEGKNWVWFVRRGAALELEEFSYLDSNMRSEANP